MSNKIAPKILYDTGKLNANNSVAYPISLLTIVNNNCTYSEQKILLALLSYEGDGSCSPSIQEILKITGITQPNHYFKIRKTLEKKGYLVINDKTIYVDIDRIMSDT